MKTLKLLLLVIAFGVAIYYTESKAQTQFDYLGGLPISANATGCFYIDLNTGNTNTGENDVKIVHGNGEIYFDALYADSMKLPVRTIGYIIQTKVWQDCGTGNSFTDQKAYIIKNTRNIGIGSHVLPFTYANKYHYLVLRVTSDSVYVRGWQFNISPELFECYQLSSLKSNTNKTEFLKPE